MKFSFLDLGKRFWHYAWVIVICAFLVAGGAFLYAKGSKTMTYTATRSVVIGKTNTDLKDPNSRYLADNNLIPTYKKVAVDDAVVNKTRQSVPSMTSAEIGSAIKVSNPSNTLVMEFAASAGSQKQAIQLVNAYTEAFAKVGQQLYPDMPAPNLLSSATDKDVTMGSFKSPKKLAAFGFVLGAVGASFGILITGIHSNYKLAKRTME